MGPDAGRADYKCKASVMRTYLMSLRNSMGGLCGYSWVETRWDLGPGTARYSTARLAPGYTSPGASNKIWRNYVGPKITVCMHSWGKLWTKRYKKTKKTHKWPLLKIWEKKWCQEQKQGTANVPCTQYHKVKVKSLSRVQLFATPWAIAYQAPLSMGFSRQ